MNAINSILDTDLYKFTTSYAYMKLFPRAVGTFTFIDRAGETWTTEGIEKLKLEISKLKSLELTDTEKGFMWDTCPFVPRYYWEWLGGFRFDQNSISISTDMEGHLMIEVTDFLYKATLWEVPVLAIVSEVSGRMKGHSVIMEDVISKLEPKIKLSNQEVIRFSEFGTRRRFSYKVQDAVVEYIKENSEYCNGTSNCHLAQKHGLVPMGTFPHEWIMFHGAIFGYKQANHMALENWSEVYDGDLGIALTDTYTTDVFFDNFSKKQAKLFDGVRQDSGDEFKFTQKALRRYKELGIDPSTKTIVFSNALDFEKALEIQQYCRNRIKSAFGIGTNLTNDTDHKPSNIVMKLTSCCITPEKDVQQCVKLSDDLGKHTGSLGEVGVCLSTLSIE